MYVATRGFLVLTLSFVGVFASLAEVNAGRFCRRASACPCVPVECCVPVQCVPVECVPVEYVPVENRPIVKLGSGFPTVKGNAYTGSNPETYQTKAFTVKVLATTASGGPNSTIGQALSVTSSTGTFSITSYTDSPTDGQFYIQLYLDTNPTGAIKLGPFAWNNSGIIDNLSPVVK